MHVIAAKAVCFKEALHPSFKKYQSQIIKNAKVLAKTLTKKGYRIVSGGTDNHMLLVDLTDKNITGKKAADILDKAGITVNKNLIPFDKKSPSVTSGLRLGTPAVTTRGMKEAEMVKIANIIDAVIKEGRNVKKINIKKEVARLTSKFPLYQSLIKEMK